MGNLYNAFFLAWLIFFGKGFRINSSAISLAVQSSSLHVSNQSNVAMQSWYGVNNSSITKKSNLAMQSWYGVNNRSITKKISSDDKESWMDEKDGQLHAHIAADPTARISGHLLVGISWDANGTANQWTGILNSIPLLRQLNSHVINPVLQYVVLNVVMEQTHQGIQTNLQNETGVTCTAIGDPTAVATHVGSKSEKRQGIWMQFKIGFPEANAPFWQKVLGGTLAVQKKKKKGSNWGNLKRAVLALVKKAGQEVLTSVVNIATAIIDEIKNQLPEKVVEKLAENDVQGARVWVHDSRAAFSDKQAAQLVQKDFSNISHAAKCS